MLKIYDVRSVFQINRQQWEACGDAGYACKDDSEVQEERIILDKCPFSKAFQEIYNNYLNGIYANETKHLTAEQAIQYFKDRGMTVCPISLQ